MKSLLAATCLFLMSLFLTSDYAVAEITFDSILVTGSASAGSDSDSFSFNTFTPQFTVSAESGMLLDSSSGSSSAEALFFGSPLGSSLQTITSAFAGATPPRSASASVEIVIRLSLDSSFDVSYTGSELGASSNFFNRTDVPMSFAPNSETFRIGPGTYSFGSSASVSSGDNDAGFADSSSNITFTAVTVPEPSSLGLLIASCLAIASRRKRLA